MADDTYRFQVGDIQCIAVSDGSHTYVPPNFPPPATLLFANAPADLVKNILQKHGLPTPWTEWISSYTCLVIDTGTKLILVDTGAGDLAPTTGKLLPNLANENITPQNIDTVIITHGHPDHLGGNVDANNNPMFPNTDYIIMKDEWDFWTTDKAEQKLDEHSRDILINYSRKNLLPVQDRIHLVDYGTEVTPGVRVVAAPGHTPGHMAVVVSSGNERLFYIADVFLHPVHLEYPDWNCVFDVVPELVPDTRRKLLMQAVDEKALVMAFHLPFPGIGHVVSHANVWQWKPI